MPRSNRETKLSFAALSRRSNQVANFLRALGLKRGDHLLLLLGNVVPLWETMLAAIKLGVVVIPATTLLTPDELRDRLDRGRAKVVVAAQDQVAKFEGLASAGNRQDRGRRDFKHERMAAASRQRRPSETFTPDGPTQRRRSDAAVFHVRHDREAETGAASQRSYPVGGLSTMYWLGLQPGDVHLNISSPGWAKHAWSCFFAPWNAGATVFVVNQPRFDAKGLLATIGRCGVTTLCAPPTVWRLFIQEKLADFKVSLREVCGAGEPLNPEVIDQVKAAWGLTIRDGYGQTETTALAGNSPGQKVKIGSMGRPLPGYRVRITDADGNVDKEGEVALLLGADRPAGLMQGYQGDDGKLSGADGELYRSGDVVFVDDDGYLTFVGRSDDVFKSSDYRISPFELESILLEHELRRRSRCRAEPGSDPPGDAEGLCAAGGGAPSDRRPPRCRSSSICTRGWRRSSASAGSNWSPNCRKPFREKSAACNCAASSTMTTATMRCADRNSAKRTFRSCRSARPDRRRTDDERSLEEAADVARGLSGMVGQEIGVSSWHLVDQKRIDTYADVIEDQQFIHVDPERAKTETPFGTTVAHGFLTMSLMSIMSYEVMPVIEGTTMGFNYGFDKLRFMSPVRSGSRVRGRFVLAEATVRKPKELLSRTNVTVEIEGETKPALVADWLGLIYFA